MNMNTTTVMMLTLSLGLGSGGAYVEPTQEPSGIGLKTYDRRADSLDDEPELAAAIADLREAVARRDASLVEPWLADRVYWGEQEGAPKSHVVADMRVWSPEEWEDLGRMLQLGAAITSEDSAIVPFTVEALSDHNLTIVDEIEQVAADGPTPIHVGPDGGAPVLATVERAILAVDTESTERELPKGWVRIKLPNRRMGYVSSAHLSGTASQFAVWFERGPEGWRVVAFGIDC